MSRKSNLLIPGQHHFSRLKLFTVLKVVLIVAAMALTTGCLYRQDVQQGNEITWEMVDQLETGMTKLEVVRILGYPLINDPFHRNRWDYYYSLKEGGSEPVAQHSVSLQFDGDALATIETNMPERPEQAGSAQDNQDSDTGGGY